MIDKLTGKFYKMVFGVRNDIRPGIKYFDASYFNGLIKEDYSFKNDNGFILKGAFYHYNDYDPNTLIIFNHGIGGGHEAYMKEINYVAKNGFKVLAMDYQGCVNSEGDCLEGLTQPILDMSKLVGLVKNDYQNVYVVGHSWGGFVSQGLTALNPEIKKVVLIAGLNSVKSMFDGVLRFPLSLLKKSANRLEYNKYGEMSLLSAATSLNRSDLSALVIQSRDDSILNPKYNIDLIKNNNSNDKVDFYFVNGKNHNPTYTKEAVNYLTHYLNKLNKLHNKNDILSLENSADFDKMSELDEEVMNKIVNFLKDNKQ